MAAKVKQALKSKPIKVCLSIELIANRNVSNIIISNNRKFNTTSEICQQLLE